MFQSAKNFFRFILFIVFLTIQSSIAFGSNHFFFTYAGGSLDFTLLHNDSSSKTIFEDSIKIMESNSDTILLSEANSAYAKEILQKYLSAIGGEEQVRSVTDRVTDMKGMVQGIETEIMFYQKYPNKLCQRIIVGEVEQKIIYDGTKGVKITGDVVQEISGNELVKLSYDAVMNLILDPESQKVNLQFKGIEEINGRNAYKILLMLPNGAEWIHYYDMESGLKVRDTKDIFAPQGKFLQIHEFDDYRNVEGILYPFKIKQFLGSQMLDFTVESIKVNTGLTDEIFVIE